MPVPAVSAGDPIRIFEVLAHADGNGLLADVEMHRARQATGFEILAELFLDTSNKQHLFVHLE